MEIMASGPTTSWQIDEETMETVRDFILEGSKITADGDCSHEIKRCLLLGRKVMTNLGSILKSRHYFANKGPSSQCYGFSSGHVWMWELDHKESWAPKIWTVVLEKTLESPLDCKEIQPVHPKGNRSWIFIGRTDAEVEALVLWPPDVNNWLIEKDSDAGKDWRQEEKGTIEDEMVGWYHRLNGNEFEQALGVGDGQESLACCSPWGCRFGHDWATELTENNLLCPFGIFSLKCVRKFYLFNWFIESLLCLEFISAKPSRGHSLRGAGLNSPTGLVNCRCQ